jgi:hypothetical protein
VTTRFTDPETQQSWAILSEWRQEASPGVVACTSYEVVGGPKRYARKWDHLDEIEWGWVLHPTARRVR